jgi:hypothetical protein
VRTNARKGAKNFDIPVILHSCESSISDWGCFSSGRLLFQTGAAILLADSTVSNWGCYSSGRLHCFKLGLLFFLQTPLYQTGAAILLTDFTVSNWGY